ncbi:MAG: alpha/beta hydrolase [Gammaproteobacteria bacterium]|nr:alpha/beta hydrolase [Gammaproteobacteria bacterium]MDH3856611.1 alpha/beta hydrolase [Gammaproteobacteria bacterium]
MAAIDVSYRIEGQGPALYLVHGIGARKTTWNELVDDLKQDFTCVSYDLRGHGESPIPPTPYTLDDLVDDLEALRLKLGHEKIHIAGHSLGGMIGPAYARAYPEHTQSVGLLSTAAGRSEDDRAKLKAVGDAMEQNGIAETLGTFVARWFTDAFIQAHPDLVEARLQQVNDTPADVFLSVFWIYATTEMAPWLHEVKCPCLVLTGELDGGCNPRLNQFIDGELPSSRLVILEGLKHALMIEASDQVLPLLREFLLQQS